MMIGKNRFVMGVLIYFFGVVLLVLYFIFVVV